MKEINIAEADIAAVATEIVKFASDLPSPGDLVDSRSPAVRVIDCVLSLNRPYKTVVVPRLNTFVEKHPDIQRVTDLAKLMANYPTPNAFVQQELDYDHADRARILHEVVMFLCRIIQQTPTISEEKSLKQWLVQAQPQTHRLNIRGFGPAGFQYLCILFGIDTTKPDIYVIRFVSEILNRNVSDLEAHALLEAASESVGLSVRAVDRYIWNRGERGEQYATDIDTNEKPETEYSEFWAPILKGELGELFAGKSTSYHDQGWMLGKMIGNVELWFRLTNRKCYIRLYFLKPNHFERRDKIMELFPESKYDYEYKDTSTQTTVIFPILDKGKNDRDDWDEIREKLVGMGTDIYNKINESDL